MDLERANHYIDGLYSKEQLLRKAEFLRATELQNFTEVVDDDVARLIRLLILISRPKRILEIGTSIGFSTCSMASMLKKTGGQITTIEFDPVVAEQAKSHFNRLGYQDVVDLRVGDARNILPTQEPDYDLVFQDADKRLYPELLPDCLRLLRPGGLLLAEDSLFPVMELDTRYHALIEPINRFNTMIAESTGLFSTLLPLGDGLTVAVKLD